uniref:Uncharacterized protein n=1 Tax=Anopheles atroparvus TaxID=41427 RepID=A0AAG5D4B3_ANOAO
MPTSFIFFLPPLLFILASFLVMLLFLLIVAFLFLLFAVHAWKFLCSTGCTVEQLVLSKRRNARKCKNNTARPDQKETNHPTACQGARERRIKQQGATRRRRRVDAFSRLYRARFSSSHAHALQLTRPTRNAVFIRHSCMASVPIQSAIRWTRLARMCACAYVNDLLSPCQQRVV